MSTRTLPPLEVGQTYTVADLETYEYRHQVLTGSKCILSLHLKNGTILDVPSDEEHLKTLLRMLCAAFPPIAVEVVQGLGWLGKDDSRS